MPGELRPLLVSSTHTWYHRPTELYRSLGGEERDTGYGAGTRQKPRCHLEQPHCRLEPLSLEQPRCRHCRLEQPHCRLERLSSRADGARTNVVPSSRGWPSAKGEREKGQTITRTTRPAPDVAANPHCRRGSKAEKDVCAAPAPCCRRGGDARTECARCPAGEAKQSHTCPCRRPWVRSSSCATAPRPLPKSPAASSRRTGEKLGPSEEFGRGRRRAPPWPALPRRVTAPAT